MTDQLDNAWLAELRAVADAVYAGGWRARKLHDSWIIECQLSERSEKDEDAYVHIADFWLSGKNDALFCEAFDPPTARALLDEIERLRKAMKELATNLTGVTMVEFLGWNVDTAAEIARRHAPNEKEEEQ